MRKVWIPKEALIPVKFYRRKLFMFFMLLILSSILFLAYQLYFVSKLASTTELLITERQIQLLESRRTSKRLVIEGNPKREIVKGIRIRDIENYTRIFVDQKFRCIDGSKEILWDRLNDDFCDCSDGSDETFTNACRNGKFYCTKQLRHQTGRGHDVFVRTSRINDGICDCKLDCSDEFK